MRNALSCSRINVLFITESAFCLQYLQTHRDDEEKSGDSPTTVKFSLSPAVVVVLKKLPCPANLNSIPQIRQQLSLDDFGTFLSGVFGNLVNIFLCFLHGELTNWGVRHNAPSAWVFRANLSERFYFRHVLRTSRDGSVAKSRARSMLNIAIFDRWQRSLFSRQRTPGKGPLLRGKENVRKRSSGPRNNFEKIFGNLRKIVKNVVIGMLL